MNPPHHRSTPSSPPSMEPSHSSPVDSVHPSPPTDALESIREMYEKTDPVKQIDPLITFVENQLQKLSTPLSEAGSSSSEGWLESVPDGTELAAKTIHTISTEAEKLSDSDAVKAIGGVTLEIMDRVEDLHCVLIGLSVATYAVVRYRSVGSTDKEWRELLLKILDLSKHVKQCSEQMPMPERERLCNAVGTIVEGAVIFCDYLKKGKISRFWSPTTAAAQLAKINQQLGKDYGEGKDVFLSHSGEQKNFVRQLREDLKRENVSCFFDEDYNSLPLGKEFPSLMLKAAETCKTAVVVISKKFIESKWPMHELSAFISAKETGKNAKLELIPIFFKISPRELSRVTEDCQAWKKLKVSNDTRAKWQHALNQVRAINGVEFVEDGNEVDCRNIIVKHICCFIRGINLPRLLDFEPVGIEEQVRQVKKFLDMEGDEPALAVIVYGFGGLGKSTIAAFAVQSLNWSSTNFKFCSVAIDENTVNKTSHIIELQKYIINKLGGDSSDFQNPREGRAQIREVLKNKCSLLFIDNVVDKEYIRDLLPRDFKSGTRLRIIITSRDKNVNAELNIICKEYEVKGLSDVDSKRLLRDTIVQGQIMENNEKSKIDEIAVACRGVPLLLSVFGKHLRVERNEDSFKEALDILRKGNLDSFRDEDLGTKLMFVYDKIKDVEVKEAFLDICKYFHGWEWDLVADIVDCAILKDLQSRTLLSKSGSGEVIVHHILRLMGLKKAGLTRFSNYKELSDALEGDLVDFRNVKGISLVNDTHLVTIQSAELEAMHQSLRVLILGDWVTLDGTPCVKAFRNLRYLCLGDVTFFPFKYPSKLHKLRVFLNRSQPGMNLSHLPPGLQRISHEVPYMASNAFRKLPFQNSGSLKSLVVKTHAILSVKLPEEFHLPASLVHLNLSSCNDLPKDIGHLTSLESLILDGSDLERLPEGFDKFQRLKHLSMNNCSTLMFLSEELGMLSSLEELSMERLLSLKDLSESFGKLCISNLKLKCFHKLEKLPNSFGNMPLLKYLRLESCESLTSLPSSFVQLKMLENLQIHNCPKLSILPKDFGRLRCLNNMTVTHCSLLKELPHGFEALPALKTFILSDCRSFVKLAADFTELTSLEELHLKHLHWISRIPDGFGKLKRLRYLFIENCSQLKTLSDDFENMATLERLKIRKCPNLEGAMMEKILKLQNCSMADIEGSMKLLEKWEQMQSETEYPIVVFTGIYRMDRDVEKCLIMKALLNGKCLEVNNSTGQLMERSSLLVGLEEGKSATVAFVILPFQMRSDQRQMLERFVEMAREREETDGWGMLQIVCARRHMWTGQRRTPTEEEQREEKEDICQILVSLPKGSCALSERVKILTEYHVDNRGIRCWRSSELKFFVGHVVSDTEGRKSFENFEVVENDEISNMVLQNEVHSRKKFVSLREEDGSILNFIEDIIRGFGRRSSSDVRQILITALKGIEIHHLDIGGQKVMVDDLHGKTIALIMCQPGHLKWINVTQIHKDFQQDPNFIAISIPTGMPVDCGHGSHTRLTQGMPWATILHPQLAVAVDFKGHLFVVLHKEEETASENQDAWGLLMGWGSKFYPFTRHSIRESFLTMESESSLEILLHGMNIVGRKTMKSKMTFLFAARASEFPTMKCQLEQLTQIHGDFEVLYLGRLTEGDFQDYYKLKDLWQEYKDTAQEMRWPSLSVSDWFMFWNRCRYFAEQQRHESNTRMMTYGDLAIELYKGERPSLVLLDNDGVVTRDGQDVVRVICEPSDDIRGLLAGLSRGECSVLLAWVKTWIGDEIDNHPLHPQHRLYLMRGATHECNVCSRRQHHYHFERSYRCGMCGWSMCDSCRMAYAKHQARQLVRHAGSIFAGGNVPQALKRWLKNILHFKWKLN